MGQGLGPGFTIVATRRSVIFSADGLEFVFTAFGKASSGSLISKPLPKARADVFITSRRLKTFPLLLFMANQSFPRPSVVLRSLFGGEIRDLNHSLPNFFTASSMDLSFSM